MKKIVFFLLFVVLSGCYNVKNVNSISQNIHSEEFIIVDHIDKFHIDMVESILSFYDDTVSIEDIYVPDEFKPALEYVIKKRKSSTYIVQSMLSRQDSNLK